MSSRLSFFSFLFNLYLFWVYVVIEHMVNLKWFRISTSWTRKFPERIPALICWVQKLQIFDKMIGYQCEGKKCHCWYRLHGELHLVPETTHRGHKTSVNGSSLIGPGNVLPPARRQAITWTNATSMSIGPVGTNSCEILFKIQQISYTTKKLKISTALWRPFYRGPNVLIWVL